MHPRLPPHKAPAAGRAQKWLQLPMPASTCVPGTASQCSPVTEPQRSVTETQGRNQGL